MIELMKQPWPWYVAGLLIGLTVPALLVLGNKQFGISANLRHVCAACLPAKIPFFKYDWKKEAWNLFFAAGIIVGSFFAIRFLANPEPVKVAPALLAELETYDIIDHSSLLPSELFSISSLFTFRGLVMLVGGGFLVGFGARYAGGCTSGHAITGIASLQKSSLIATISFMGGGFLMANVFLPFLLKL
jgi:uncharacterized membrane protein YedE/YeeE